MALEEGLPLALWLVPVGDFGGVARHVTDVVRAGLPGYRLVVLAPAGPLTQRLRELDAKVIEADFGTEAGFIRSYKTLNNLIDTLQPAVLHSHLAYADVVAAAVVNSRRVGKLLSPKLCLPLLVTTEHGIAGNDSVYHSSALKAKGRELMHRLRLLGTDRKIAVSRSTAEQMRIKWGARKVDVILNSVDVDDVVKQVELHKTENSSGSLRLLSLSRLAPEKGLDLLLAAFAQFHKNHPSATLELAGSGELKEDLLRQAAELGVGDAVSFPGFVNPYEAMGRNDLVVQLSIWENLSYTLLDAKAAGLQVIATRVGGNSEILDASELVPPLAEVGTEKLVELVSERLKIYAEAGATQKQFSWQTIKQMTSAITEVYGGVNK